MQPRIESLIERSKEFYKSGDPAHDWAHVQRVIANGRWLAQAEGAQAEIVIAAAALHDIVNLPKNHPQRREASRMAARAARQHLRHDFTESEIDHICVVIEEHSFSLGRKPSSLEAAVLQDADRLDAIGAIGIFRTIACGTQMGSPFYKTEDPFAQERELEDRFMVDHFYIKTLKLADGMNTATARKMAEQRVEFMRAFLERLRGELTGDL